MFNEEDLRQTLKHRAARSGREIWPALAPRLVSQSRRSRLALPLILAAAAVLIVAAAVIERAGGNRGTRNLQASIRVSGVRAAGASCGALVLELDPKTVLVLVK